MSNKTMQDDLFMEETEVEEEVSVSTDQCRRVLVPYPVDKAYDYMVPEGMDLVPGDYVCVPLSGREVPGVVWGEAAGDVKPGKLKSVISRYDVESMPDVHRSFIDWVSHYTMSAKGSVLKMSLSAKAGLEPSKPVKAYRIASVPPETKGLSPQRQKVLEVMADGRARRPSEIAKLAGCSAAVVKGMSDKGLLSAVEIVAPAPCRRPDPHKVGPVLSEDQRATADHLKDKIAAGGYYATLLDGVTGAGKTEVYFEAVAEALKQGKQVLILLPEIALSNAFLDRFQSRFGCTPALWHSHLTTAQRRNAWRGVVQGETKVIVGARSALFLPYANLGLIIVDEEHDPAYKQEDGVIYHARDMAITRAYLGTIPIVLVSATPSLETMINAWEEPEGLGRFDHLSLPDRFGGAHLPEIEVINVRVDNLDSGHFVSPKLMKLISDTTQSGNQSLLFLNRRGYAPLTLCRTCGHRVECPRCTAWLVEHRKQGKLMCHHCGFQMHLLKTCPECHDENSFAACGPGVERIYEEIKAAFPEARTIVLASDTSESGDDLRDKLREIRDGNVDIIIGTQIIAKGHHFPKLTLVGVIDADIGLNGGELRAAERTYQLLHQVAGRAGREKDKGHVYLQTYMPEHRIIKALATSGAGGGRDEFLAVESQEREYAHMPPYSRLAGIIVAGRDESQVVDVCRALGESAPQGESIQTFGPAPAPMARLRGKYRYRLLVRAEKSIDIQKAIAAWLRPIKVPSTVRVYIDIDPQSFL